MIAETTISITKTAGFLILLSMLNYLNIDGEILTLYGFLMFIDFITGFMKSFRLKNTASKKAFLGLVSKALMLLLIFTIAIAIKIVDLNGHTFLKLFISALSIAELYSIVANIYTFRTGKAQSEFDAVSFVLGSMLKLIKEKLETIMKKLSNLNK